jgi:hypothetical protein
MESPKTTGERISQLIGKSGEAACASPDDAHRRGNQQLESYLTSLSYCAWMESTNCCGFIVPSISDWKPGTMALAWMPAVALLM